MSNDTLYTEDHEWVQMEGDIATIGITDFAQEQLGDVVFVDLPEVGKVFDQGDDAAVVESVKAASEVFAPVGGEVIEVNEALADNPALVNEDAEGDGWFFKIRITDADELDALMSARDYKRFAKENA